MKRVHRLARRLLVAALVLVAATRASATEDADCMKCHGDPAAKPAIEGGKRPPLVDAKALAASAHFKQGCVYCHQDLDDATLPHKKPEKVDCATCHEKEGAAHAKSLHGQALAKGDTMAPRCQDCHGSHDVLGPKNPESRVNHMNIPRLCGGCHHEGSAVSRTHDIPQDRILENYSEGMHGEGLYKKGLSVTAVCNSCHTSHDILPHTDPKSSIHHDNVAKTCLQCHTKIEQVHRKVIEGKLWESEPHKIPACVDCHQPHKVRRVFYPAGVANKDCLRCHADAALAMERDGKKVPLCVDEAAYGESTHKAVGCAQCHSDVDPSHDRPCDSVKKKVDCAACHADVVAQYQASVHGTLRAKGDTDAPTCLDCHSKHATQSRKNASSPTYPRNVPNLCARCHREGEKAAKRIESDVKDIVGSYKESIHGTGLLESGLVVTATCVSCHTAHGELPPSDPKSTVNKANIADTCGGCHNGIEATLKTSIHWPGNGKTDKRLPTCNDCHTSHTIGRTDKPEFRLRMQNHCGDCHAKEFETFLETFHGKVSQLGAVAPAKCHDCHGSHGILPPSDPKSTLSRDNVVGTCGKCHEDSHRRFAGYLTHATHHDVKTYPWLFWTFWAMTSLLVGTLAFALFHTVAWLLRLWLTRGEWRAHRAAALAAAAAAGDGKLYRRFDRYQRMQHFLMLISFFTLAITGMSIKFSYAGWASLVARTLGGSASMRILHRTAAVLLVSVFVAHLVSVNRKRKAAGKTWLGLIFGPDSLMFSRTDWTEFVGSMKWFFGLGPRPRYGRYAYWEKFDYMAVFWGVFIIGSTGLVLWFPEIFTRVLPGWSVNVATIVHSDEALLAVAFIFTIHFFNTHFRPDKFPMDPVIFTGRVTLDELKHDKPREYEEMLARGELAARLVEPFPKPVERGLKAFGFGALAVGLTLIGLIVYAMVFQYR